MIDAGNDSVELVRTQAEIPQRVLEQLPMGMQRQLGVAQRARPHERHIGGPAPGRHAAMVSQKSDACSVRFASNATCKAANLPVRFFLMSRRRDRRAREASLELENELLKKRLAALEEQVQRLVTQPPVPQFMPIPVVVPCPCPAPEPQPYPWRLVPNQPYQPTVLPVWPQQPTTAPVWPPPQYPEIICGDQTTTTCVITSSAFAN